MRVERKEVGSPGTFDDLIDDQLERAMRERLNALGLSVSRRTATFKYEIL